MPVAQVCAEEAVARAQRVSGGAAGERRRSRSLARPGVQPAHGGCSFMRCARPDAPGPCRPAPRAGAGVPLRSSGASAADGGTPGGSSREGLGVEGADLLPAAAAADGGAPGESSGRGGAAIAAQPRRLASSQQAARPNRCGAPGRAARRPNLCIHPAAPLSPRHPAPVTPHPSPDTPAAPQARTGWSGSLVNLIPSSTGSAMFTARTGEDALPPPPCFLAPAQRRARRPHARRTLGSEACAPPRGADATGRLSARAAPWPGQRRGGRARGAAFATKFETMRGSAQAVERI